MAVLANLPADAYTLSENIGCNIRQAEAYGLLTDADVSAASTAAALQASVSAASVHADIVPAKARINNAISLGEMSGEFSDARVAGVTTIAGLIALTADASTDIRQQQMAC